MENISAVRASPYPRKLLLTAVYDVLEAEGCGDYEHDRDTGIVRCNVEVYGNRSGFEVKVDDWMLSRRLTVEITKPAPGLSDDGKQRAVNYLADEVAQYLENEWKIKALMPKN